MSVATRIGSPQKTQEIVLSYSVRSGRCDD